MDKIRSHMTELLQDSCISSVSVPAVMTSSYFIHHDSYRFFFLFLSCTIFVPLQSFYFTMGCGSSSENVHHRDHTEHKQQKSPPQHVTIINDSTTVVVNNNNGDDSSATASGDAGDHGAITDVVVVADSSCAVDDENNEGNNNALLMNVADNATEASVSAHAADGDGEALLAQVETVAADDEVAKADADE